MKVPFSCPTLSTYDDCRSPNWRRSEGIACATYDRHKLDMGAVRVHEERLVYSAYRTATKLQTLPRTVNRTISILWKRPFSIVTRSDPFKTAILGNRDHLYRIKNEYHEEPFVFRESLGRVGSSGKYCASCQGKKESLHGAFHHTRYHAVGRAGGCALLRQKLLQNWLGGQPISIIAT